MKMPRPILLVGAFLALGIVAALAVQPGTRGTDKLLQESGFRSAVLIQKNNTATATGGQTATATMNAAGSGIITTASLAIPADSDYALTLTNNMIEAGDAVFASVGMGSATVGKPYVAEVTESAGSVLIRVRNASGATTLDGTLKIKVLVVKQSANGSD